MAEQRDLHQLRHVDAGVLQQRGDVVGGRAHQGVLEVEQADAGDARASGSQIRLGEWKSRSTQVGVGFERHLERARPTAPI